MNLIQPDAMTCQPGYCSPLAGYTAFPENVSITELVSKFPASINHVSLVSYSQKLAYYFKLHF